MIKFAKDYWIVIFMPQTIATCKEIKNYYAQLWL